MNKNKQKLHKTFKSSDTEEWLDIHFTRPIGFLWARFFNYFNIHPNTITILSIIIGLFAGIMFYFRELEYNIIGVLLLMWANFYDSADGQLARMTGKKTRLGRILDGFAGDIWFITIYAAICLRLYHQTIPGTNIEWNIIIFFVVAVSGIICHSRQCQLADYYRNIHMYFSFIDSNSELETSNKQKKIIQETPQKGNFLWLLFLRGYYNYTRTQEKMTPEFQRLYHFAQTHSKLITPAFRKEFRIQSFPLIKYANILTFNCRAITLYVACLIDKPWIYFLVEMTIFTIMAQYMKNKHEKMCVTFIDELKNGKYSK